MGKDITKNKDSKPESKTKSEGHVLYKFMKMIWELLKRHIFSQAVTIVVLSVCLYPVYKRLELMEITTEETISQYHQLRNDIINTESEVQEIKTVLNDAVEQAKKNQLQLANLQRDTKNTDQFIKEFHKNFTKTQVTVENHDDSIHRLYNVTTTVNKLLGSINATQDILNTRTAALTEKFNETVVCQSGFEVGEHTYPAKPFPCERTVNFNPPFKKIPAFSYGTTLLDTIADLKIHIQLTALSEQSFTLNFATWGKRYSLYGARISWMACGPK